MLRAAPGLSPRQKAAVVVRVMLADGADLEGIELVVIPTLYPSGGEKQLIRILTGREVPTRGIPADAGVICQNVGTAAAIADAIIDGKPLEEARDFAIPNAALNWIEHTAGSWRLLAWADESHLTDALDELPGS